MNARRKGCLFYIGMPIIIGVILLCYISLRPFADQHFYLKEAHLYICTHYEKKGYLTIFFSKDSVSKNDYVRKKYTINDCSDDPIYILENGKIVIMERWNDIVELHRETLDIVISKLIKDSVEYGVLPYWSDSVFQKHPIILTIQLAPYYKGLWIWRNNDDTIDRLSFIEVK